MKRPPEELSGYLRVQLARSYANLACAILVNHRAVF